MLTQMKPFGKEFIHKKMESHAFLQPVNTGLS